MAGAERRPPVLKARTTAAAANAASAALPAWARLRPDGHVLVLTLHVQPGARNDAPAGRHGDALKLRIAAPAVDNRANDALLEFLRRELALPRASLRIVQGASARRKLVEIAAPFEQALARLHDWDRKHTR